MRRHAIAAAILLVAARARAQPLLESNVRPRPPSRAIAQRLPHRSGAPVPPGYRLEIDRTVSFGLGIAGLSTFGVAYGLSGLIAANDPSQRALAVPVAGPFLQLEREWRRPKWYAGDRDPSVQYDWNWPYRHQLGASALLAVDAVFQLGGLLMLAAAIGGAGTETYAVRGPAAASGEPAGSIAGLAIDPGTTGKPAHPPASRVSVVPLVGPSFGGVGVNGPL